MIAQHKIVWLLFHNPIDLFIRSANYFKEEIEKVTDGRIQVEVYTTEEYAEKFCNGNIINPLELIRAGDVHMSQLQIEVMANWHATDFHALNLPFLFKDYAHCDRVLEGEIGHKMLVGLEDRTPVRGLAFTFSGGYRLIAAEKPINSADDLKDLTLVTRTNPVFVDTAKAFGCKTIPLNVRDLSDVAAEIRSGNAIQTTLPRYQAESDPDVHKYVTNTKHSMYLTSIVIGKGLWHSLSPEDQAAIQQTANRAAKMEKDWTLEDALKIKEDVAEQRKLGIQSYQEFSEVEADKLKAMCKPVYEKYNEMFSPGLLASIING